MAKLIQIVPVSVKTDGIEHVYLYGSSDDGRLYRKDIANTWCNDWYKAEVPKELQPKGNED